MKNLNTIKQELHGGNVTEALVQLDCLIANTPTPSDELYYLRGNAYRKLGNWQMALNNYLEAIELNPDSPAKKAYEMVMNILNFYNKDMFNQ